MQMDESENERIQEEAIRAKAIAVEKYKAGDLVGAKEFAVKAQNLNPKLFGIRRLNAVLHVLIASGKKINDEVDWYAVIAVDPTANNDTIKKALSYLSFGIFIDNDNSVGDTLEAEKILAAAWKILCTKNKKQLYDKRREVQLGIPNNDSSSKHVSTSQRLIDLSKGKAWVQLEKRRTRGGESKPMVGSGSLLPPEFIKRVLIEKACNVINSRLDCVQETK